MTDEERIFREYRVMRRKRYGWMRRQRTPGEIRLVLARRWNMSCRQVRVIVETEYSHAS